jgi:circadian clock protein KaiC
MSAADVSAHQTAAPHLAKSPTGIDGLDDLTFGGLPSGRPTLLCGAAGCGKTLFGMTFLVKGATLFGEHGVFMKTWSPRRS